MSTEDSGGAVNYYVIEVKAPFHREPYTAECSDIAEALGMSCDEGNIFKEVWRRAAARQGRKKRGNTSLRGAEKMVYFAERILHIERNK